MAAARTQSRSSFLTLRRRGGAASSGRQRGTARWSREICSEAVARRAYDKFLARGGQHGDDLRDWFEAERELKAESCQN